MGLNLVPYPKFLPFPAPSFFTSPSTKSSITYNKKRIFYSKNSQINTQGVFENRDAGQKNKMSDEKFFSLIKRNNPRMFEFIQENINESIREGGKPVEENFLNMQPQAKETEE